MKKLFKSTTCAVLMVLFIFATSVTAFAKSPSVGDTVNFTTSWTDLAVNSNGINATIYVSAHTTVSSGLFNPAPCDIRMLNKSGQEVWSQNDCIPGNSEATDFWYGADVCTVQIRVNYKYSSSGSGYARTWYK